MRSMWFGLGFVVSVLTVVQPALARGIRCEDINRHLSWGMSANEIVEALGTTRTRVAACAHLGAELERHEARRAETLARQAARRAAD